MTRKRLENNNIHGPQGALLALQTVDFERMRDAELQATVVLYLSKENRGGTLTACYEGAIFTRHYQRYEPDRTLTLPDLRLPRVIYPQQRDDNFYGGLGADDFVPGNTLIEHPSHLEFTISARNLQEYQGMTAFRDVVIPGLFKAGYSRPNPQHTSVFWLYVWKDSRDEAESSRERSVLFIDSLDGLTLARTEVDGVKIFTEQDVRRFMDLRME